MTCFNAVFISQSVGLLSC